MNECNIKHKHRSDKEVKELVNRLSRIEGQIRGIKNMVENHAYCVDVINQISASRAALTSLSACILETHIKTCVSNGIKNGDEDIVNELTQMLKKVL